MFRKIFIITFFLASLYACIPATSVTTPIVSASTYISATIPQSTPTIRVIPTAKSSSTPKLTATLNPAQIELDATEQAFNDLKTIFPGMCESFYWSLLKSPDENWLAQDCSNDSLQIINSDRSTIRKVTYKEIFEKEENYPYNQGALHPVHWTNDNQYLYFAARSCCWDPGIMLLAESSTLYRMNIISEDYSFIRSGLFDISFSPTDRRVTFVQELVSPPIVEIQDLLNGSVDNLKLNVGINYNQASVNAWSTDGLRFAVSTASGSLFDYNSQEPNKFSLIIVDVKDLTQRIIVKDMPTVSLYVLNWSEDNVLMFQTGHPSFTEPIKIWQYDLKTYTLIAPTPNP